MRRHALTLCLLATVLATPGAANDRFLEDGGGVDSGYAIGFDAGDDEFLAGGGGIEAEPGRLGRADRGFLDDGGAIRSQTEFFTPEREEFLEDGGSISSRSLLRPFARLGGRGYRRLERPAHRAWRIARAGERRFVRNGSFIAFNVGGGRRPLGLASPSGIDAGALVNEGATVIDVESERLDRRPYPASGVETLITRGGSKIIRIAPGF